MAVKDKMAEDLGHEQEHKVDVKRCARCGQNHNALVFHRLTNPSAYTHWAMCPITNEPILLQFENV